jgi:hypothetical protein
MIILTIVSDLVVSPESGGERDIFIGGMGNSLYGAGFFHCTVTGDSASAWHDGTDYDDYEGWDNMDPDDAPTTGDIYSWLVTDIIVSPSWGLDKTVLTITVAADYTTGWDGVYLQCGSFGTSPAWNEFSTLGIEAVEIKTDNSDDIYLPTAFIGWDARAIAGLTLPEDYNSNNAADRLLWVWVNHWDNDTYEVMCDIIRVEDDSADPVGPLGQIEDGEVWLTNISYHGTIAEGEALAGVLGNGEGYILDGNPDLLATDPCEGVQVYRNDGIRMMDICCERWHDACKLPTGEYAMAVTYVDDDKAYAVALGGYYDYDEGAWSVTFDDGDTFNQLSLIDTYISYLSDVAVSPDCNKTFLVSINDGYGHGCDSVWLHAVNLPEAPEYSGQWLRTWSGPLDYWGLLRLPPFYEETTGDHVVLVDYDTSNVYSNDLETLACWDPIASTELNNIMDLALLDTETLFGLDDNGHVAMFDGDEWLEAVDSEVYDGYTIAVWGDWVLVGGEDGEVSYSDDGGETFTELDELTPIEGYVTVAFDSYFDQNNAIYAAVEAWDGSDTMGGIYVWIIGESVDWTDTGACHDFAYTGIVLDTAAGNPWTSPETGGVLYASYVYADEYYYPYQYGTGVARSLEPIVEICCEVGATEWDYLVESDPEDWFWGVDTVGFYAYPDALKICGCLTPDSNTHLFAIDEYWDYDMCEAEEGAVWTFEDCYAKKGIELDSPADGFVVGTSACECSNVPFMITWDRLCDACCYEFEFATDEDFTQIVDIPWYDDEKNGEVNGGYYECCTSCHEGYCPDTPTDPSAWIEEWFLPETTYYWRVRAVMAETDQVIRSWWSEPRSFTVAPTAEAGAISLVSPEPGATDAAVDGLGFSWLILAEVDNFDWVLDNNSDFSSPEDSETGLTDSAFGTTATLDYDTTYYWQVTAYRDGSEIGKSAVGTFRTMMEAEEPPPPPPTETPFWVWIVIAIGAVLVIVVIVLIFRTRRV